MVYSYKKDTADSWQTYLTSQSLKKLSSGELRSCGFALQAEINCFSKVSCSFWNILTKMIY